MSLTNEQEGFSGASVETLFSEVVKEYRTAMNDLREQAASLCEIQPDNGIPFSYYEHYIDGDGAVGQRSTLVSIRVCDIGPVFWVVVNDELPGTEIGRKRLDVTEFIFSEEILGVSMNESTAYMGRDDRWWQTSHTTGPILIASEGRDAHIQNRRLFVFTGEDYRPAIVKEPEGPSSGADTFMFYQDHTRLAQNLRKLLGACFLESPWRVPVNSFACSKVYW